MSRGAIYSQGMVLAQRQLPGKSRFADARHVRAQMSLQDSDADTIQLLPKQALDLKRTRSARIAVDRELERRTLSDDLRRAGMVFQKFGERVRLEDMQPA